MLVINIDDTPSPKQPFSFLGQLAINSARHAKQLFIVQELCESRGGRPGLSVLTSLLASVDVKIY